MNSRGNFTGDRMNVGAEPPDRSGISGQMARMVDGFSKLVTEHLALARLELAEDARAVGREVSGLAAFLPFLVAGYVLLWVGIALLLGRWLGSEWGFVLCGAVNMVVGGVGVWRATSRLRARRPPLERSVEELRNSAAALTRGALPDGPKELDHARR